MAAAKAWETPSDSPTYKIYKELTNQRTALGLDKYWNTGATGALGGVDAITWDVAHRLAQTGVTSLADIERREVPVYADAWVAPIINGYTRDGKPRTTGQMGVYVNEEYSDGSADRMYRDKLVRVATPEDIAKYNAYRKDPNNYVRERALNNRGDWTGGYKMVPPKVMPELVQTGTKKLAVNKNTGQPLFQQGLGEGDVFGWSLNTAGDGQTVYMLNFTDDGLPVFTLRQKHGRDAYSGLLQAAGLALSFIGGPAIGSAITGALGVGASAAVNAAIGSAVIGTVASGGDLKAGLKAGLAAYVAPQLGGADIFNGAVGEAFLRNATEAVSRAVILGQGEEGVKNALIGAASGHALSFAQESLSKAGVNWNDIPQPVRQTIEKTIAGSLQGQDAGQALVNASKESLVSYGLSQIPNYDSLDPKYKRLAESSIRTALSGGDLTGNLMKWAINEGANTVKQEFKRDEVRNTLKAGGIDPANVDAATIDQLAASKDIKSAVDTFVRRATTASDADVDAIFRSELGRPPTKDELLENSGLAKIDVFNRAKETLLDENTTSSEELRQIARDIGIDLTDDQIRSMNIVGDTKESVARAELLKQALKDPTYSLGAFEKFVSDSGLTKDEISKITGFNYDKIVENLDIRSTTEDEARQYYVDAWKQATGETISKSDVPSDWLIGAIGQNDILSYTLAQNEAAVKSTTFDGSGFDTPLEAALAAQKDGYNSYIAPDGKTYQVPPTAVQAIAAQSKIEQAKTFNEAFSIARATFGDNKIFTWNGQQYTTQLAPSVDAYNGSRAATNTDAAILAFNAGKKYFIGVDGKTYVTPDSAAMANVGNQSEAETRRLIAASIQAASDTQLATNAKAPSGKTTLGVPQEIWSEFVKEVKGIPQDFVDTTFGLSSGIAEIIKNFGNYISLAGMSGERPNENIIAKFAGEMEKAADARISNESKQQWKNITDRVNAADGMVNKAAEFWAAIPDNPMGGIVYLAKELGNELPQLALTAGIGKLFGYMPALGANTAQQMIETGGSEFEDAYQRALKEGKTEQQAFFDAQKVANASMAITAITAGVTDGALVKAVMGDMSVAAASNFVKGAALQYIGEYTEEYTQSVVADALTGRPVDLDAAATRASIAAGLGAATGGTILGGAYIDANSRIGKKLDGSAATISDVINNPNSVDFKTVDLNAAIGTSPDGDSIHLGTLTSAPLALDGMSYEAYQSTLPSYLKNQDFVIGQDAVGNDVTLNQLLQTAGDTDNFGSYFNDLLNTTEQQKYEAQKPIVEQALRDAGYTGFTAEDVNALINTQKPGGTQAITQAATSYADPRVTDADEARAMLQSAGYTNPTQEEIQQFVGQTPELQSTTAISEYVAPRLVTEAEARQYFASQGYTPTNEEVAQFVRQGQDVVQDQVQQELLQYIDPRQVTQAEAEQFFRDLGYQYTPEEVAQFIQQGPSVLQDAVRGNISTYVDPKMVDEAEARAAYEALGLKKPTQDDILKLVGQYSESDLTGRATENLDSARYNSIIAQLDTLAVGANQETLDAIDRVKQDLNSQISALGGDIDALQQGIDSQIGAITGQISGISADVQAKYEALSQGQRDIVTQMLQQGADLETAIDVAVSGLQGQMQAQYESLTDSQKALADQLTQQGIDLSDAITIAKSELQAQIQQTAEILGKPARDVTQADIDTVTQMIGQQNQNMAYDVNQDGTINQADVDILTGRLTNVEQPWVPAQGTVWAPTGLYAENAALRQQQEAYYSQMMAQQAAYQQDLLAKQEAARQEAARQAEAQRKLALQGQAKAGIQNLMQQLPEFYQQSVSTTKPIYAGQTGYVDINAPLQVGGIFDTWGTTANQQRQTKMASGGYLDMHGEPETWDDILRMLNK